MATTSSNGQARSSALTAGSEAGTATISASATGAGHATFAETNVPSISISALTTAGTAGKIGAGDTITTTFSGQLDFGTIDLGSSGYLSSNILDATDHSLAGYAYTTTSGAQF